MKEMDGIGNRLLVVYDGHCCLCNGWVRWLLRHDRRDRLRFVASVSPAVAQLIERHPDLLEPGGALDTVLVFRNPLQINEQLWLRFAGELVSLRELPPPWPAVALVLGWIPDLLSDPAYKLIARGATASGGDWRAARCLRPRIAPGFYSFSGSEARQRRAPRSPKSMIAMYRPKKKPVNASSQFSSNWLEG
jgi:predicted DCC family thiol-disulfide oxidoreductase YuxK